MSIEPTQKPLVLLHSPRPTTTIKEREKKKGSLSIFIDAKSPPGRVWLIALYFATTKESLDSNWSEKKQRIQERNPFVSFKSSSFPNEHIDPVDRVRSLLEIERRNDNNNNNKLGGRRESECYSNDFLVSEKIGRSSWQHQVTICGRLGGARHATAAGLFVWPLPSTFRPQHRTSCKKKKRNRIGRPDPISVFENSLGLEIKYRKKEERII